MTNGGATSGTVLMEKYHDCGHGLEAARAAFSDIENATHTMETDVSIAAFLHPWKIMQTRAYASLLNGDQKIFLTEKGLASEGMTDVDILIPKDFSGDMDSLYIDGGDVVDSISLQDENAYIMAPNAFADLGQLLHLAYSGNKNVDFLREYMFASRCAEVDEATANFVYRERNGVKRIVAFPVNERQFITFDDVCDVVAEVSRKTGKEFWVDSFDITQRRRLLSFKEKGDEQPVTITWTDSEMRKPMVLYGRKKQSAERKEDIEAAMMNVLTA